MATGLLLICGGCAPRVNLPCPDPLELRFAAPADSVGLSSFQDLDPAQQESRRRESTRYLREALRESSAHQRLQDLTNAAGLAPEDPQTWLHLAREWRLAGSYLHTDHCLTNATDAVRSLGPESQLRARKGPLYRDAMALEIAVLRAWLHYDRGEWREGLPWARAALRIEHGNEGALVIRGLLEARLGRRGVAHEIADDLRRKDPFSTDIAWIMACLDAADGRDRTAFSHLTNLRPDQRRAMECYRDMGRAAERLQEWAYASRWYRQSAAALPRGSGSCVKEFAHARLGVAPGEGHLPFWVGFDQFYVTGSMSAYLAYAYGRFSAASAAAERERWGGLVVDAAGSCLRLDLEDVQARRARGMVYARTGHLDRALGDLNDALVGQDGAGRADAELVAELGHVHLLMGAHRAAIPHLRRATALMPEAAQVWSDLGLSLIMADERTEAAAALDRALALDGNLVAAWYNRGLMHAHAGDLVAAEADLACAARLAPDNREVGELLQQVVRQRRAQSTP